MANEATMIFELQPAIPFTISDTTGIERGAILNLTDPMTAAASATEGEAVSGIAASEKIASDGKTKLGVYRIGIFRAFASGAIAVGEALQSAGENYVKLAPATLSGAQILGTALETAADGERFLIDLNIGAGTN